MTEALNRAPTGDSARGPGVDETPGPHPLTRRRPESSTSAHATSQASWFRFPRFSKSADRCREPVELLVTVARRMAGKRLADVRVPRYVAALVILVPILLAFLVLMSLDGGEGRRRPDRHSSPASPASLRAVFVVRIGPPFGGFRLAFRPGFIDWPEGFVALEAAVTRVMTFLIQLPPDQRSRMLSGETGWPQELAAQLGDRPGFIDGVSYPSTDGGNDVVLRGSSPFSWWPLGEWVVFQGVHIRPDNHPAPLSYDALRPLW